VGATWLTRFERERMPVSNVGVSSVECGDTEVCVPVTNIGVSSVECGENEVCVPMVRRLMSRRGGSASMGNTPTTQPMAHARV
jgi:hypothetical protein